MYNGVIVKFGKDKFSLKTNTKCYWCQSKYWKSEEEIREFRKHLHPTVLNINDFTFSIAPTIKKMLEEKS